MYPTSGRVKSEACEFTRGDRTAGGLEPVIARRLSNRLETLRADEREALIRRLHAVQTQRCLVCDSDIRLDQDRVDIDHIRALARGGLDEENNWAVAHESCNRSKGTRDLQVQRFLYVLKEHIDKYTNPARGELARNFTVGDALAEFYRVRDEVSVRLDDDSISLTFATNGKILVEKFPLLRDPNNPSIVSFIGMIPFNHVFHDPTMNPRSIVDVEPLIVEFYNQVPQLQPSLATLSVQGREGRGQILLFDGQHKAAAQLYVRSPRLFLRTFVNCDKNLLKEANFRAHTKLAQIHFPQLTSDKVGHDIFSEAFSGWLLRTDQSKATEAEFFETLADKDTRSEFLQYSKNYLRYEVITGKFMGSPNRILSYVETVTPRSRRYPLSYDALEKGFINEFLSYGPPTALALKETQRHREMERTNLVGIMNIFTEEVLEGKFNLTKGVYRLEQKVWEDPDSISDDHLRAYRMCKKAALIPLVGQLRAAVGLLVGTRYRYHEWAQERPLWIEFNEDDWKMIRKFVRVAAQHKVWIEKRNQDILRALESTRQKDWTQILVEGKLPGRTDSLFTPMNFSYLFTEARKIP